MTIREARRTAVRLLSSAEFSEQVSSTPGLDVDCLLSEVLHTERSFLLAHDEESLNSAQKRAFFKAVQQRQRGFPVAYICGHKEFFGFDFIVTPDVLIPKPDTELLVRQALFEIKKRAVEQTQCDKEHCFAEKRGRNHKERGERAGRENGRQVYIADICTGSGCVALSVLKTLEQDNKDQSTKYSIVCDVSDISKKALAVARKNAFRLLALPLNEKLRFFCADLLEFCPPHSQMGKSRYDLIMSNPPYVPSQTVAELLQDGRKEPFLALDGGKDGLDLIRRLILQAYCALKPEGVFLIETGEYNIIETQVFMTNAGFVDIVTYNDLGGLPRVTRGVKR